MMALLLVVFVALGCAAWCASLAEKRGRPPVPWGILGLCTGLIGVLITALMPPISDTPSATSADALGKLAELHRAGDLTDDEYTAAKQQMLDR